jgi:hypothetical protein
MAGGAAERVLVGRIADGLVADQQAVTSLCEARGMTQAQVDRLWSSALALVRANETSIRCVVVELQRRGRLSGEQIDALMRSGSM